MLVSQFKKRRSMSIPEISSKSFEIARARLPLPSAKTLTKVRKTIDFETIECHRKFDQDHKILSS